MVPLLLAFLVSAQPAPIPSSGWPESSGVILSTVGHSEWCPPGNVRLDLGTGRYLLAPHSRPDTCNAPHLQRPVRQGAVSRATLERLRAASLRLEAEGVLNPDCRAGRKPQNLVISNGGTPHLALSTVRGVTWSPDDLSCWSKAGMDLHQALERVFGQQE